jgi:hypothetical protein
LSEIGEAVENRGCGFGIMMFKENSQCPNSLTPVTLNGNLLVTTLDSTGLDIALEIGETVCQIHEAPSSQGDMQKARDMLDAAVTETRKLTSLVSLARSIKNDAGKMMNQVEQHKEERFWQR